MVGVFMLKTVLYVNDVILGEAEIKQNILTFNYVAYVWIWNLTSAK